MDSQEDENAIQQLLADESIVVVKSDKGNSLVLLDKEVYIKKGMDFLSSENFQAVSSDDNEKLFNSLKYYLAKFKKSRGISEEVHDRIMPKPLGHLLLTFYPKLTRLTLREI